MDLTGGAARVKVVASAQIVERFRSLHPEHRAEVKKALRDLARGKGDVKELAGNLAGFYRLRVGRYRIVFRYQDKRIEAFFLEHRSVVYELFRF